MQPLLSQELSVKWMSPAERWCQTYLSQLDQTWTKNAKTKVNHCWIFIPCPTMVLSLLPQT